MFENHPSYHVPVLLNASIEGLNVQRDGVYLDVTYGGGGHSKAILDLLGPKGRLYGFDQDREALANVNSDPRLTLIHSNFRFLDQFMNYYNEERIDGVLADLGVSSHHFDDAGRGFSYRFDSLLDMRMNQAAEKTAADILMEYTESELQNVFSRYGELRNARSLSIEIAAVRRAKSIRTVSDLTTILDKMYRGDKMKYYAQVFQALRIELNDEMGTLKNMFSSAFKRMRSGSRLVVISYHSIEDRIAKDFCRKGDTEGRASYDNFGRTIEIIKQVNRKPIIPDKEEIMRNPRASSAKLRIAEKL